MIVAGVGHSILLDLEEAVKDACSMAMEQMGSTTVDFLLCFATTEFASHYPRLFKELETRAGTPNIVGCSAMAVLTGEREFEGSPGLAILAISSDELKTIPFLADDPSLAGETIQELTKDRLSQGAAGNA
ncbi:MAG: FIST N-terminal domain-containing protein, partial [Dehalococcoidia bacterium]